MPFGIYLNALSVCVIMVLGPRCNALESWRTPVAVCDSESGVQSVILESWSRIPGCLSVRTESDKELGVPDISLRCPWFEVPVELKFDDRAMARDSMTLAVPNRLTGHQRSKLIQLWGRPFPSAVLHYHVSGWWVVIPALLIPNYLEDPWRVFSPAMNTDQVRFMTPSRLFRAMERTWRIFREDPLLGPESLLPILRAISVAPRCPEWLRDTSGAQDEAIGGPPEALSRPGTRSESRTRPPRG
jgi:hypothetical protein